MSAYFAPAFFGHLLGKCLKREHPLLEVSKMGLTVIGTFAAAWWPYLYSTHSILEVTYWTFGLKFLCIIHTSKTSYEQKLLAVSLFLFKRNICLIS